MEDFWKFALPVGAMIAFAVAVATQPKDSDWIEVIWNKIRR